MVDKEKFKKYAIILGASILFCVFAILLKLVLGIVGNPFRADVIYKQALNDLKNKDYANAYFQFSKVSYLSNIKPYSIYHRAECARELGDLKSEQRQLYLLFNVYPKNELATRAKYLYALAIMDSDPKQARRLLNEIIIKNADTDYALGAKYQLAVLLDKTQAPSEIKEIEMANYLKDYLMTAPTGRWALKSADLWLSMNTELNESEQLLIADVYIQCGMPEKALNLLDRMDFYHTWTKQAKAALTLGQNAKAHAIIDTGLRLDEVAPNEAEKNEVIFKLYQTQSNKEAFIQEIADAADGKNDLYIKSLRCRTLKNDQLGCFANMLKYYDYKQYSEAVLFDAFHAYITNNQLSSAKQMGLHYLEKYPNTKNTPFVMYWVGKILTHEKKNFEANDYFRKIISNYPDSYYAYRSFLNLNKLTNPILSTQLEAREIIFPYYGTVQAQVVKMIEFKDLDILGQIYENDKFVQSWILYEKGEKSKAMCMARDAMRNLDEKPDKTDLRWRLVYPTFLFEDMANFAKMAGNNDILMLALAREESYFNPNAQSGVGAVGLMQLMPETAVEINMLRSLGLQTIDELKNPKVNMKMGNFYYNYLLTNLANNNILAIAAYNGGIGSISRWKKGLEYRDIDEFVEKIPYSETRNYVKKVYSTYWNYSRIYQ